MADRRLRFKKEYLWWAASLAALAVLYHFIGCPFRFLFGVSCPGCGMVRALFSCVRLDFAGAWEYHPMVFALPVLTAALILLRKNSKGTMAALLVFAACLTAVYVYRMAAGTAPETVYFRPGTGVLWRLLPFFHTD